MPTIRKMRSIFINFSIAWIPMAEY